MLTAETEFPMITRAAPRSQQAGWRRSLAMAVTDPAELLACLGSLLMVLDRRVPRDALLAIGLSAVALLAALDDHGVTIDRLILGWSAFAGASSGGPRARRQVSVSQAAQA